MSQSSELPCQGAHYQYHPGQRPKPGGYASRLSTLQNMGIYDLIPQTYEGAMKMDGHGWST